MGFVLGREGVCPGEEGLTPGEGVSSGKMGLVLGREEVSPGEGGGYSWEREGVSPGE